MADDTTDSGQSGQEISGLPAIKQRVVTESEYQSLLARIAELEEHGADAGLIPDIFLALDDLDRALVAARAGQDVAAIGAGVELVGRAFLHALARQNVDPIPVAEGDPADPELHESLHGAVSPGDVIQEELRRGYRRRDMVLRRAIVRTTPFAPESDPEA